MPRANWTLVSTHWFFNLHTNDQSSLKFISFCKFTAVSKPIRSNTQLQWRQKETGKAGKIPRQFTDYTKPVMVQLLSYKRIQNYSASACAQGKHIYSSPSCIGYKQYYFTIILHVKFLLRVCLDLCFFWTRGQSDNLEHKSPIYIYLFNLIQEK